MRLFREGWLVGGGGVAGLIGVEKEVKKRKAETEMGKRTERRDWPPKTDPEPGVPLRAGLVCFWTTCPPGV